MILDLGIVKPGTTLNIPFHTFDSNDPSASVTVTGLAVTDIEIYKDGSLTQRASDAGYAIDANFDGLTGIHTIQIDLSDNTTAGFFEAGSEYLVGVSSITVDAATVSFWAARFIIGYQGAVLNTTIATLSSQTSFTLEDGSADNDAYIGCPAIIHDVASDIQVAFGYVSDYVGTTKTVTLAGDPGIFTMAAGDNISLFPPANVQAVAGTTQTAGDIPALITTVDTVVDGIQTDLDNGTDGLGAIKADTAAILVDTAVIGAAGAGLTAIPWNAAWDAEVQSEVNDGLVAYGASTVTTAQVNTEVDTALSDIGLQYLVNTALPTSWAVNITANSALDYMADDGTAVYDRTTDSLQAIADSGGGGPTAAQIADAVWDEAQADHVAAGSFGVVASEVADILVDTAVIGAAGAGLTAVPWNAAWDAEVQSEVTDALNAYDPPTRAELTSDINSLNDPTAATIADAVWDELQSAHVTVGSFGEMATEVASILVDTAEIGTAGAGLTNINLPDQTMNITGNLSGSVGSVTGAVGSVTGAVGSVTAGVTLDASAVDAIWDETLTAHVTADSAGVHLKDIVADTNELQTDDVPTTLATLATAANLTTVDTVVDAIKVKTDQMVFTKANELDVNTQSINGATVVGDGNATPWDGA